MRGGNRGFVVHAAPVFSADELLARLGSSPGVGRVPLYLLDSGGEHPLSRFVLAGAAPTETIRIPSSAQPGGSADPWQVLTPLWERSDPGTAPPWPVARNVGYLAYEFGAHCERFPERWPAVAPTPDAIFQRYDAGYVSDRARSQAWVWGDTADAADALRARLLRPSPPAEVARLGPVEEPGWTRERYLRAVRRVLDYIAAGDIYQANISRRLGASLQGSSLSLYRALRPTSPAPFGGYLDFGELQLLSFSPERFLCLDPVAGIVETRPIKGTRPRADEPDRDQALQRALLGSAKDRAEHVMIVDLERNDLGRVCRPGSVRVARLAGLESFSHVHHLVSVIEGRLRPAVGLAQVLRATFPGGSITGAPKVRAMEIIAEVEQAPRGPSFGAFGYVDRFGRVDLALAIRTAVVRGDRVDYAAGGGIVADSEPEGEYQEASLKASVLLGASVGRPLRVV